MMEHVVSCINMTLDVAVLAVSGRRQGFESLLQLVDNTCADSFDLSLRLSAPMICATQVAINDDS